MPKQRTGYVYYDEKRKAWTARLTYKDDKLKRLKDPNKRDARQGIDSTLKLASVHRELQLMRAVTANGFAF
jgi:hypothetical protein